jgi:hypothetical protein
VFSMPTRMTGRTVPLPTTPAEDRRCAENLPPCRRQACKHGPARVSRLAVHRRDVDIDPSRFAERFDAIVNVSPNAMGVVST